MPIMYRAAAPRLQADHEDAQAGGFSPAAGSSSAELVTTWAGFHQPPQAGWIVARSLKQIRDEPLQLGRVKPRRALGTIYRSTDGLVVPRRKNFLWEFGARRTGGSASNWRRALAGESPRAR